MSTLHRMLTAYTAVITLLNTTLLLVATGLTESFEVVGNVALVAIVVMLLYPLAIVLDIATARGYLKRFGLGGEA